MWYPLMLQQGVAMSSLVFEPIPVIPCSHTLGQKKSETKCMIVIDGFAMLFLRQPDAECPPRVQYLKDSGL